MGLSTCRDCGNKVSDRAAACPMCGAPMKAKRGVVSSLARVFLIVFVVIPVAVAVGLAVHSDGNSEQKTPEQRSAERAQRDAQMLSMDACGRAQEAVKTALKAPATAKFPGCALEAHRYKIRATEDRSTWWIEGYVDSQNSFGALMRSQFIVKMARKGEQWSVLNVAVE
jgi:uncharacterized protein YPO0396